MARGLAGTYGQGSGPEQGTASSVGQPQASAAAGEWWHVHPCFKWSHGSAGTERQPLADASRDGGCCPTLSTHRLITPLAIPLGKPQAQHCVRARQLGSPGVHTVSWGHVGAEWLPGARHGSPGRTSPPGRCQEGGKPNRQRCLYPAPRAFYQNGAHRSLLFFEVRMDPRLQKRRG